MFDIEEDKDKEKGNVDIEDKETSKDEQKKKIGCGIRIDLFLKREFGFLMSLPF